MSDEMEEFEARLKALRPIAPSQIARERIRLAVARSEARSWRKYQLMALAAVLIVGMVLFQMLIPVSVQPVPGTAKRNSVPAPTLAAYQSTAVFESDKLDDLLMKQSSLVLPPTPELKNP